MRSNSSRSTRRQFLTRSAAALAGLSLSGRTGAGMASSAMLADLSRTRYCIPDTPSARHRSAESWFPDVPSADQFRALALVAMDAARQAGADAADIRIGVQREFETGVGDSPSNVMLSIGYGVRARVGGIWSMQHGVVLTPDRVAAAARTAVAGAKAYAAINRGLDHGATPELAPAPVVTGEWRVPYEIDPFAVPVDDAQRMLRAFEEIPRRFGARVEGGTGLRWFAETRVFASMAGSLVSQALMRAIPTFAVTAYLPKYPFNPMGVPLTDLNPCSAGYEVVLQPWIPDAWAAAAEEAIRLVEIPVASFADVGRYPVVFSGRACSHLLGKTLDAALDGDRLAGFEADASGSSFLSPVAESLASRDPLFSPLLTVTANRTLPSYAAVQWDDDGITPEAYTLIDAGRLVDVHTTRDTAPLLADWYRQRGQPLRSHGCAVAVSPTSVPVGGGGHLSVVPATSRASLTDLAREMSHGFVVLGGEAAASPGLTLAMFPGRDVLEVRQGKVVSRMNYLTLSVVTKSILHQKLVALGDRETLRTRLVGATKGMPWETMEQPVTAPAVLCKDVDVVRPGASL